VCQTIRLTTKNIWTNAGIIISHVASVGIKLVLVAVAAIPMFVVVKKILAALIKQN